MVKSDSILLSGSTEPSDFAKFSSGIKGLCIRPWYMIENRLSEQFIFNNKFCDKLTMLMGQHFCCFFVGCPVENVLHSDCIPLLLLFFHMTVEL